MNLGFETKGNTEITGYFRLMMNESWLGFDLLRAKVAIWPRDQGLWDILKPINTNFEYLSWYYLNKFSLEGQFNVSFMLNGA